MARREEVIFTNMCMVYDGERVLVQDRRNPRWQGITFPGGHVEYGESFTDAVIREVYEETGLTIRSPQLCGIDSWDRDGARYVVLLYKTDRFTGEIRSSEEGEVFWTTFDELATMKMPVSMDDMLKIFRSDELSELYWSRSRTPDDKGKFYTLK